MKWLFGFIFGTVLLRTLLPVLLVIGGVIYFQGHSAQVMGWVHAAQHGLANAWNSLLAYSG